MCCQLTAVLEKIITDQKKIIEKFSGAVIVTSNSVWPPVVQALSRESQAHSDDGEFESNRFFGIDPQEAWIEIRKEAQV